MRMYDLIEKKKHGHALTKEEISYMVTGFVNGEIPDYQMSAMLMAIYFQGMNDEMCIRDRCKGSGFLLSPPCG